MVDCFVEMCLTKPEEVGLSRMKLLNSLSNKDARGPKQPSEKHILLYGCLSQDLLSMPRVLAPEASREASVSRWSDFLKSNSPFRSTRHVVQT